MNYTYLTKTGLLHATEESTRNFFTSNEFQFRRFASQNEVFELSKYLPEIDFLDTPSRNESENIKTLVRTTPEHYKWKYLWQSSKNDYTSYKAGTCNNGGDYAFYIETCFFGRNINGIIEVIALDYHSTSADFSYTDDGNFQHDTCDLHMIDVIGLEDNRYRVQGQEDEEISLSQLATSCTLQDALYADISHTIHENDEDLPDTIAPVDLTEFIRRVKILKDLAITYSQLRRFFPKRRRKRTHRRG